MTWNMNLAACLAKLHHKKVFFLLILTISELFAQNALLKLEQEFFIFITSSSFSPGASLAYEAMMISMKCHNQ